MPAARALDDGHIVAVGDHELDGPLVHAHAAELEQVKARTRLRRAVALLGAHDVALHLPVHAGIKGHDRFCGKAVVFPEDRRALASGVGPHAGPAEHQIVQEDVVLDRRLLQRPVGVLHLVRHMAVAVCVAEEHDGVRRVGGVDVLGEVVVCKRLVVAAWVEDQAFCLRPRVLGHVDEAEAVVVQDALAEIIARVLRVVHRLVGPLRHGDDAVQAALLELHAVAVVPQLVPALHGLVQAAGVGRLESLVIEPVAAGFQERLRPGVIRQRAEQGDGLREPVSVRVGLRPAIVALKRARFRVLIVPEGKEGVLRVQILPRLELCLGGGIGVFQLLLYAQSLAFGGLRLHVEGEVEIPRLHVIARGLIRCRPAYGLVMLLFLPHAPSHHAEQRHKQQHQHDGQNAFCPSPHPQALRMIYIICYTYCC